MFILTDIRFVFTLPNHCLSRPDRRLRSGNLVLLTCSLGAIPPALASSVSDRPLQRSQAIAPTSEKLAKMLDSCTSLLLLPPLLKCWRPITVGTLRCVLDKSLSILRLDRCQTHRLTMTSPRNSKSQIHWCSTAPPIYPVPIYATISTFYILICLNSCNAKGLLLGCNNSVNFPRTSVLAIVSAGSDPGLRNSGAKVGRAWFRHMTDSVLINVFG